MSRSRATSAAFPLVLLMAPVLSAQSHCQIKPSGVCQQIVCGDATSRFEYDAYTATWKIKRVQRLPDGTTATFVGGSKIAQDNFGRHFTETDIEVPERQASSPRRPYFVDVMDPIANVLIKWTDRGPYASVVHQLEPASAPRVEPFASTTFAPNQPSTVAQPPDGPRNEDLGAKIIFGVVAIGTRSTYKAIEPSSAGGFIETVTIVEETWNSDELGAEVLHITDDPRIGVITTEMTSFASGEPDPALFRPPEGYTVRDVYPGQEKTSNFTAAPNGPID